MSKGFTLIELLAVIVILAIISLIAVPIVLTVISDSKTNASLRSAEFYINSVEQAIMKQNIHSQGNFNPTDCSIGDNGVIECEGKNLIIEVDGERPSDGFIKFSDGEVINAYLKFKDSTIVTNELGKLVNLEKDIVCTPVTNETKTLGNVPNGKFQSGDEYICEVKPGIKYNFFVLSTEDNKVNLILDRNISSDGTLSQKILKYSTEDVHNVVAWISEVDYGCGALNSNCSLSDKGPISAINFLNSATSSWSNIGNLNEKYADEQGEYKEINLTGKARLPKLIELQNVGCELTSNTTGNVSCPSYLLNYLNSSASIIGEGGVTISGMNGYWGLSSVQTDKNNFGVVVYHGGGLYKYAVVYNRGSMGVRPVISVPKEDIQKS